MEAELRHPVNQRGARQAEAGGGAVTVSDAIGERRGAARDLAVARSLPYRLGAQR